MEPIGEAVLVLRTDVKEYIASLEDAKKRAEEFQQRLDKMSAAAADTVKPLHEAADNINNFGRNTEDAGKKADGAGAKVDPLSKKMNQLSSGSHQASIALGTLNSRLQSMAFAAVFTAIGVLIPKVLQWAGAMRKVTIETDALNKTILDGSIKYGLLSKSQREVTETTVALFNAEIDLAQFRAVRDQGAIREKIKALEEENEVKIEARRKNAELLESMQANHPLYLSTVAAFTKQSETILENNVEIERLTSREKDLTQILTLKKTTLEEVTRNTGLLTDAMKAQEQAGRSALEAAQLEARDRAATEEQKGRSILEEALRQRRDEAAIQEQRGADIQAAGVREFQIRQMSQEAIGLMIQQAAVRDWQTTQRYNELRIQSYADTTSAIASLTDALFVFSGQKSKALFNLNKVANIANAIMDTWGAATKALNSVPYPFNIAAAASVAAAGLANVARISSVRFGSTSAGGGGSIGAASGDAQLRGGLSDSQRSGPPMSVTVQVNALDPSSVNWDRIFQNIADGLGRHLGRGGSTGPVTLNFERA